MASPDLKSPFMTPKGFVPVYICQHCKAEKRIRDGEPEPERCWNYKCRRADWNRAKILPGRPRNDAKKAKARPPKQGKGRKKGK